IISKSSLFPYTTLFRSKKGSLNSTTAEGLLLGNFPIWTFGFWSIPLSLDDYYRNLSICQVEQFLGSSTVCTGAQNALYVILLLRSEEHTSELQSRVDLV